VIFRIDVLALLEDDHIVFGFAKLGDHQASQRAADLGLESVGYGIAHSRKSVYENVFNVELDVQ
jgi:hypothetical protein